MWALGTPDHYRQRNWWSNRSRRMPLMRGHWRRNSLQVQGWRMVKISILGQAHLRFTFSMAPEYTVHIASVTSGPCSSAKCGTFLIFSRWSEPRSMIVDSIRTALQFVFISDQPILYPGLMEKRDQILVKVSRNHLCWVLPFQSSRSNKPSLYCEELAAEGLLHRIFWTDMRYWRLRNLQASTDSLRQDSSKLP